ncbi:MAG: hypothetical protein PVH61_06455 [Candidatus Aminicenantes bacterium]|jgi:hypothetical protein
MLKKRKSSDLINLLVLLCMLLILSPLQGQEHEKIVEKVVVENIEVPVRVFQGKQLVGGLKKEDFQLFLNGKRKEINGFFEVRKNLVDNLSRDSSPSEGSQPGIPPRLFVVIFNLSSITEDLTSQLDMFFERIIRPNDRLMVLTNRFFISEWEVVNKEEAKRKIMEVLDKDMRQLRMELLRFETELRASAAALRFEEADSNFNILAAIQRFFLNCQRIREDIKDRYLSIPVEQYIKIAEYLKSQQADKWVINFFQMGRLPQPNKYKQFYYNFIPKLRVIDTSLINDIAKAFLNSGATVHTQLLLPNHRHLSQDFQYKNVSTEPSSIMTKLSHLTGGKVLKSNSTEKFIKGITTREDIVYILTYVPDTGEKRKKPKLTVKVKNRNYRVTYDNKQRLKSFEDTVERLTQNIKDLEIESLSCNHRMMTFRLKNIQVVQYEGEKFSVVQTRIKILDQHSHLISDFKKVFKGKENSGEGTIRIKLPSLGKGRFHIVLEVRDLFSLKSVTTGDSISIQME